MNRKTLRILLWCLLSGSLWSGGLAVRRAVLQQQTRTFQGEEAPFTMESALQYRMTQIVAKQGTLPERDDKVLGEWQAEELRYQGVNFRETYSVGAEGIYAAVARVLPQDWSFAARIRWASAGIFCLAIPFAALWIGLKTRSFAAAAITGGLLILSPAFAVRSSGLELSRENLAVPLFCFFYLAEFLSRDLAKRKGRVLWALLAAGSLAWAQCVWDLTQYVTGCWVLWSLFRRIKDREEERGPRCLFTAVSLALLTVSWLNPYLRAHQFFFSPVMALLFARTLLAWMPACRSRKVLLAVPLVFWLCWLGLGRLFVENYSHFSELLQAKIRFLNVKPEDPGLLTYEQRIMWTPQLNSSTKLETFLYFPVVLWLLGVALLRHVWKVKEGTERFQPEFFYAMVTLLWYVLFFRFHVFLILFAAVCTGTLFASARQRQGLFRKVAFPVVGLAVLLGLEAFFLLRFEPIVDDSHLSEEQRMLIKVLGQNTENKIITNRWGRPGILYKDLEGLLDFLNGLPEAERGTVVANFPVSASILAGTELPIVLHPKFETPGIRERVREFYEHLFLKSEKELRDWAVGFGARYYVHGMGNFSDRDPRNSPRYMVDALEVPAEASVQVLEKRPLEATWFRQVFSNNRFAVYRIVTPEDEDLALRYTRMGAKAFDIGDFDTAEKRAWQALSFHWKYPPAQNLLRAVKNRTSP